MSHKKILGVVLILEMLAISGGYFLLLTCREYDLACGNFFLALRSLLILLPLPLLPITTLLFFLRREIFTAWAKFAVVGFPVMLGTILYVFYTPHVSSIGVGINDEEILPAMMSILFLLISLGIIGWKSWRLKKQP